MSSQEKQTLRGTRDGAVAAMAKEDEREIVKNYKGFVAGVFSGIAKLTGECSLSLLMSYSLHFHLQRVSGATFIETLPLRPRWAVLHLHFFTKPHSSTSYEQN